MFEEIKYRLRFPPRAAAVQIKSELAGRGRGTSTALAQLVAKAYLEVTEKVLDEFTDTVISRAGVLGLSGESELRQTIAAVQQRLFDETRSFVLDELKGLPQDYRNVGMAVVDERRGSVWDHLQRMIELRKLDTVAPLQAKEKEQKFGILLSAGQASRDFEVWKGEALELSNPIALLFVDLDYFKRLNERLTHAKVDKTVLPEGAKPSRQARSLTW